MVSRCQHMSSWGCLHAERSGAGRRSGSAGCTRRVAAGAAADQRQPGSLHMQAVAAAFQPPFCWPCHILVTTQVPIIKMYGVMKGGNSVAAFVHGFEPYFFVEARPLRKDLVKRLPACPILGAAGEGQGCRR